MLIELKEVTRSYNSTGIATKALQGVSLKVDQGEFIAIMGPSGSGKSTLMNILGFLDVPTSGKYFFEDKMVSSFEEDDLADIRNRKIGFVFQSFYLLPRMSAIENVKLPMIYAGISDKEQNQRAEELLKKMGLGHRIHNNPNMLSGGEQQRVAIARALSNDPKIIFADEPTGNLDSKSSHEIMSIFTKLHEEGRTIIMVSHDRKVADFAEKIVHVEDGQIKRIEKNK